MLLLLLGSLDNWVLRAFVVVDWNRVPVRWRSRSQMPLSSHCRSQVIDDQTPVLVKQSSCHRIHSGFDSDLITARFNVWWCFCSYPIPLPFPPPPPPLLLLLLLLPQRHCHQTKWAVLTSWERAAAIALMFFALPSKSTCIRPLSFVQTSQSEKYKCVNIAGSSFI